MSKNHDVDVDLKGYPCRMCGNLDYWDGYFCKMDGVSIREIVEKKKSFTTCKHKIRRTGRPECQDKVSKCVFWCEDCPAMDWSIFVKH